MSASVETPEARGHRLVTELTDLIRSGHLSVADLTRLSAVTSAATHSGGRGAVDLDHTGGLFSRADAEAFAEQIRVAERTPGAITWDDEIDLLAVLDETAQLSSGEGGR